MKRHVVTETKVFRSTVGDIWNSVFQKCMTESFTSKKH